MTNEPNLKGSQNIVLQNISEGSITLNINGGITEIQNQLTELKSILTKHNRSTIQYADKIYNIEHITEANFGFITGKKAFNESLTKQLIQAIIPYCLAAERFSEKVSNIPSWETQIRFSDKAKEIIAYSFVGVIGIQLSKLMAIGKEDFSESKQRKYIEKCIQIVKRSTDLICFALISKLWDAQKQKLVTFSDIQRKILIQRFDAAFEHSIEEQFQLLSVLQQIFSNPKNELILPFQELENIGPKLNEGSDLHKTCQDLQILSEKLDRSQYNLVECFEAETLLTEFFTYFHFLVNYRMASIKYIGYRQSRNADAHYLHRYTALGIDNKANIDAEKINYTTQTIFTDAVLLYRGVNYQENINMFPFVIDYNALTFEQGTKICFYRSKSINDNNLEYMFMEDNSTIHLEKKGIQKPDTDFNELMMSNDNLKILNLDNVVELYNEARQCLLNE